MRNYPNINVIAVKDGYFTIQGGKQVMEGFLRQFPAGQIDIVRSDYSDMTMGALESIRAAGRTELLGFILSKGGHIDAIEAIISGYIAVETQIPPYFGQLAIQSVFDYLAGKPVPARQEIPFRVFESNNPDEARSYLNQIRAVGMEF